MATQRLSVEYASSANLYLRVYDAANGDVFDFADNTFKSFSQATTPHKFADAEQTGAAGQGRSQYLWDLDLSAINNTAVARDCIVKIFDNGTPSPNDNAVKEPVPLTVRLGRRGLLPVEVKCEMNVKSTSGSAAQIAVWLEHDGRKVDVDAVDSNCTAQVVVREHQSGVNLFTKTFTAADLHDDVFEAEQSTPNFTDDRQYQAKASVTLNGVTFTSEWRFVTIG